MTKKLTKIIALAVCAVLLVGATIAGTVAYLTSKATVSNTFTYGNVAIRMDDAAANEYGVAADKTVRADANSPVEFKLIPGGTYTKNTVIHVESGSETCYLFVKVDDTFANIAHEFTLATGWVALDAVNYPGVYYYKVGDVAIVDASNAQKDVLVLDTFTVKTDAIKDTLDDFTTASITAYAVQSAGFDTAALAWANTFANA